MIGGLLLGAIVAIIFAVNWMKVRAALSGFASKLYRISCALTIKQLAIYSASAFFIYVAYMCDWDLAFDNHNPRWAASVLNERVTIMFSVVAALVLFILGSKGNRAT